MNNPVPAPYDRQHSIHHGNGPPTDLPHSNGGSKHAASPPPNRKSSEAVDSHSSKKRRKISQACLYCRRSHMTCDLERPCARCVKRDIGHLCYDEPREPPRRSKSEVGVQEIAPAPDERVKEERGGQREGSVGSANGAGLQQVYAGADISALDSGLATNMGQGGQPQLAQPIPISPTQLQRHTSVVNQQPSNAASNTGLPPQSFDWSNAGLQNQFQDMHHLHPNYMFNTSEVTNEYNLLNDFLSSSLLDDGNLYSNPDDITQTLFSDPLLATSSYNALNNTLSLPQTQPPPPLPPPTQNAKAGEEISRPGSAFPPTLSDAKAREKFYLTAADPAGLDSAGNRLHKLLKAKYDAGMLKPFNYVKGYARLQAYMSRHLHPSSQRRILEQLGRFRPKFREAMQGLSDVQLVLVEMWFERSLMEYDRVFASMAIPACCWRRTGEIFRGNREMADLLGVPVGRLRDGRVALHEVLAEESLVSYWEKFGAIAFDGSQKAILTSCTLKNPGPEAEPCGGVSRDGKKDGPTRSAGAEGSGKAAGEKGKGQEGVRCCFSFTIRRDMHNIPSLIVGNFLPIRPRAQPT
ncbi:Transcription factor [Teratosphaeriaceae sp. CCFEE 6253]|nr:Transcription factor [Teratosphaeriaceae sp. CCFEE 6253]